MKKKVGTVLEERVLREAKARASREGRPLAALLQEATERYLQVGSSRSLSNPPKAGKLDFRGARGLGRRLWKQIDTEAYLQREREAWD